MIILKKINVLKNNEDFDRLIKNNKPFVYKDFLLYVEKNTNDLYHFGISISKHTTNAVGRNKLKRQIREIISHNKFKNSFNCVIIARKSVINSDYNKMKDNLEFCFNKLNLIEGEEK